MSFSDWIKKLMSKRGRELDPIEEYTDLDPNDPFPDPVDIEITDIFDLHTIPPRDVKRVVEEYLFQAREKGLYSVRIIHGKGVGVQRTMVRSILAQTPFVTRWTDAPPEAGGQGATIVMLNAKEREF